MQLLYFPYLGLKAGELNFGDFKIWSFKERADKYIKDINTRAHVEKIIQSNLLSNRPIDGMAIFSSGDVDFHELTKKERVFADEARLIMFLTFLSKVNASAMGANAGHFMATSENFTYTLQNFELGNEYVSEQTGYITTKLVGGYKLEETKFHAPSYLLTPMRFSIDEQLYFQLLKLRKKQKNLYRRILRATDLFFQSYFNDPYVSLNSRILLMVSAFEVLLDLPETGQRKVFKEKVDTYLVQKDDKIRTFYSERGTKNKVKETASIKIMWADKFYTLRNHIIHGSVVRPKEFNFYKQRHIEIALMFFIAFIKAKISEKYKKKVFADGIVWGDFEYDIDKFKGFAYQDNTWILRLHNIKI